MIRSAAPLRLGMYVVVGLFTVFALLPFYIMLMMSTYSHEELYTGLKLWVGDQFMVNLRTVLKAKLATFYWNSAYITVVVSTVGTLVSALAGYAFAKFRFRGQTVLFGIVLATLMIPSQLSLVGLAVESKWYGMYDTHWPLILPSLANAFGVFWLTQFIKGSVPSELLEAAKIDGCGETRTFFSIVMPNIVPALTTIFLLMFVGSWNSYIAPLIFITSPDLYTVPLSIPMLGSLYRTDNAARILAVAISTLPVLLLFAAGYKHIAKGIMTGSVKG